MNGQLEQPRFASAMRGYDRLQVDDYIARLGEIVSDAEERARLAESELEFSRHATVGPRVSQILDLAVEEAKELRERVDAEVERVRSQARAQCDEMVARARDTSAQIRAEAESARADILADADAKRLAILAEVERLDRSRGALLRDLERLQHVLADATSVEFPLALPAGSPAQEASESPDEAEAEGTLMEVSGG
jgi:cell division septum initiation protein DivIVA